MVYATQPILQSCGIWMRSYAKKGAASTKATPKRAAAAKEKKEKKDKKPKKEKKTTGPKTKKGADTAE